MLREFQNLQRIAAVICAVSLSGCAAQIDAQVDTIAADDAALCQYSAAASAGGAPPHASAAAQCRKRLESQRVRLVAANASRIDGYALLKTPAPDTAMARRCDATGESKQNELKPNQPKVCAPGDVTGTISKPKP